jgi:hypothetical protein
MLVVILAGIAPFIMLAVHGYMPSLSSYWTTDFQPLFIIANTVTAVLLYTIKNWKGSAYLLVLLTAFSTEMYPILHNLLAIVFFFVNLRPLFRANHYKYMKWIYLSSLIVLPFSMFYAEIIAIDALCIYHGLMLNRVYKVFHEKGEIEENIQEKKDQIRDVIKTMDKYNV